VESSEQPVRTRLIPRGLRKKKKGGEERALHTVKERLSEKRKIDRGTFQKSFPIEEKKKTRKEALSEFLATSQAASAGCEPEMPQTLAEILTRSASFEGKRKELKEWGGEGHVSPFGDVRTMFTGERKRMSTAKGKAEGRHIARRRVK